MRVLFVHYGDNWIRGSERCMIDLACGLRQRGHQAIVACNAEAVVAAATGELLETVRLDQPNRAGPLPTRGELIQWADVLSATRPDVIHVNSTAFLPPVLVRAMMSRIPVVMHQHILDDRFSRLYSFMHQASAIVTISREAERSVASDGYPAERLYRIPNGVRPRNIENPVDVHEAAKIPTGCPVAISIGSLIARKGFDRVIRAFQGAARSAPELHLVIVGSGPEEGALRHLAAQLGVESRVRFLGERDDVPSLVGSSTFLVTGARAEVQPLTVIEAMLEGVPVVASDIAAHREMVEHERVGLIADADCVTTFGAAIQRASVDVAWRTAASRELRATAPALYGFDAFVGRFLALYESLVSAPRARYGFVGALRPIPAYADWIKSAGRRRLFRSAVA